MGRSGMALVTCEACGKEISAAAASCPGCGHPRQVVDAREPGAINMGDPVHFVGIILVLLFVIGIVAAGIAAAH